MFARTFVCLCLCGLAASCTGATQEAQNGDPCDQTDRAGISGEVIFASDRLGSFDLFSTKWDSDQTRRLTRSDTDETQPAVSQNGQVAFTKRVSSRNTDIFLLDVAGHESRLTATRNILESDPVWSPSGDLVIYSAEVAPPGDGASLEGSTTAGKDLVLLPNQDNDILGDPSFRSDGHQVLFTESSMRTYVFSREVAGKLGETAQLVDEGDVTGDLGLRSATDPAWSPDAERFLISSNDWRRGFESPPRLAPDFDIFVADWPSDGLTRVVASSGDDTEPAWMDTRSFVYQSDREGSLDLFVADIEGCTLSSLTDWEGDEIDPAWKPSY